MLSKSFKVVLSKFCCVFFFFSSKCELIMTIREERGKERKGWEKREEKEIVCILPGTQTPKKKRKQSKTYY